MFDKPHEECGVFGIYNKNQFNAVHLTYLALYAWPAKKMLWQVDRRNRLRTMDVACKQLTLRI